MTTNDGKSSVFVIVCKSTVLALSGSFFKCKFSCPYPNLSLGICVLISPPVTLRHAKI
jgi:hypothetical protein